MAEMIRTRMTAQEFKQLPETNLPTELINGELFEMDAPLDGHQKTSLLFTAFLLQTAPGGEIRYSPIDVYLDDLNVLQPDVMWVSAENTRCRLIDGRWYGAPDLVIEIFSPSTTRRDKKEKFELYEKFGVREYWMADPEAEYLEVWVLQESKFARLGIFGPDENFVSPVLGDKVVDVSAFFK